MMMMGVVTALLVAFTLFPSIMRLLKTDESQLGTGLRLNLTGFLARATDRLNNTVLVIYGLILLFSVIGLSQLNLSGHEPV